MATRRPASTLLEEVAKSDTTLAPYNAKGVRETIAEMLAMSDDLQDLFLQASETPSSSSAPLSIGTAASATVFRATIARNKRCLLAYHMHRADRIEALTWLEGETISSEQRAKLCGEEVDYWKGYTDLLAAYQDSSDEATTNLRMDLHPPKYDKILVRALAECGEVMLGRGSSRVVRPGDILLLSRTDALPYVNRGQMQEMNWET